MPKQYLLNCNISVELFVKDGKQFVFIADDNSSGCEYPIKNLSDVGKYVNIYLENNKEYL